MNKSEVKKLREFLGMTQSEFAQELGISKKTVSQWEIGYRKPSSLARRAMMMLKELRGEDKTRKIVEKIRKRLDKLNTSFFKSQLKENYQIQLSRRMKKVKALALPEKKVIRLSISYLEKIEDKKLDELLAHEMLHCYLYEKGRAWGHTKEFKNLLKQMEKEIKSYEYSAKDNISGLSFVCLAEEKSLINSIRFIYLLFKHFKSFGIDTSRIKVQSNNGSEFIGSTSARKRSAFTKLIEDVFGAEHTTIPVATPRFNGGVENFHGRIEDEFYSLEDFTSAKDVQGRLFGYMLYYNLERPNQGEGMNYRTPFEFFLT